MLLNIKDSRYIQVNRTRDVQPRYYTLEQDIKLLSAELYRLIKLPYTSRCNIEKIGSIESQIMNLEEIISAYQRDQKKYE